MAINLKPPTSQCVALQINWKLPYLSSGMKMSGNVTVIGQTRVDQANPSILSNDRQSQVHLPKSSSKNDDDATVGPIHITSPKKGQTTSSFLFHGKVLHAQSHASQHISQKNSPKPACSIYRGTSPILLCLNIDRLFKVGFSDCQFLNSYTF